MQRVFLCACVARAGPPSLWQEYGIRTTQEIVKFSGTTCTQQKTAQLCASHCIPEQLNWLINKSGAALSLFPSAPSVFIGPSVCSWARGGFEGLHAEERPHEQKSCIFYNMYQTGPVLAQAKLITHSIYLS